MSDNISNRLALIQLLNGLPPQQLDMVIVALKVPNEVMPSMTAPHGDRTFALIQWVEGSTGCGLQQLQSTLNHIRNSLVAIPEINSLKQLELEKLQNTSQGVSRIELAPDEYRNREILLNRVYNWWIRGVLENSLYKQILIILRLEEQPEIAYSWELISLYGQKKNIRQGTQIIDHFDQIGKGGTLLLLGEPGSGKTTILLHLASDLISRAKQDNKNPVPVIFNLSSWANKKLSISDWLIEELSTKYFLTQHIAKFFIISNQLILLLDGLDEIKIEYRDSCIVYLNAFHKEYNMEIVVCSRTQDYNTLSNRLNFESAVCLKALSSEQINDYLDSIGADVTGFKNLIEGDKALQELATSPLMLNMMTLAYQGLAIEDLPKNDLVEERRQQLFNAYIDWMFRRRDIYQHYSETQVKYWLIWLARTMLQDSQTVFLIEKLQPISLKTVNQKLIYVIGFELIQSLIIVLCNFPFTIFVIAEKEIIIYISIYWLYRSFVGYILSEKKLDTVIYSRLKIVEKVKFNPAKIIISTCSYFFLLLRRILYILKFIIMRSPSKLIKYAFALCKRAFSLIISWRQLILILLFGPFGIGILLTYLLKGEEIVEQIIAFFRIIKFQKIIAILLFFLIYGLCLVLAPKFFITHLIMILFFEGLHAKIIADLIVSEIEEETVIPNQGIIRSTINAGITGVTFLSIYALIILVLTNTIISYEYNKHIFGITFGLAFGFCFGILFGGGITGIKHLVLRIILYINGSIPWNYARFLNYATNLNFLQKVGGGYIFIHRLLLEHFAEMKLEKVKK